MNRVNMAALPTGVGVPRESGNKPETYLTHAFDSSPLQWNNGIKIGAEYGDTSAYGAGSPGYQGQYG